MKFSTITALAALLSSATAADSSSSSLPAIEIVGNKFFYSSNGSQFYIKGIAYQSHSSDSNSSFTDPLADTDACKRDIPYLQQLSTNLLRVYAVDVNQDHSGCMNALQDAGIYVIADLGEPDLSINRDDPTWNIELFQRYTQVVDMFANYTNVLGFFAGNEVVNAPNNTDAAPFVKAAIRDTKAYIKEKNYRSIPVGYSASDDAFVRVPEADYFACGDDDVHADFYGVNMYEWCGNATYQNSGYEARTNEMKNLTAPLFFSEYGCNAVQPRRFTEVAALYGDNMTDVWSGGIVYEYFQETNDYGLVSLDGSSVSTLADFAYLSSALASISPSSIHSSDVTTKTTAIACPTAQTNWTAATNLPPTPQDSVCECLNSGLSCVVADDVDEKDYSALFSYICDQISCAAINGNGTTGSYGAFVGCNPKQQLNYVLNQYYQANSDDSSACGFSGQASLNTAASTASSCAAIYSSIGSSGTGTLATGSTLDVGSASAAATTSTASATATGSTSGSSSHKSSASGSAKTSSSSKNAAPAPSGNMYMAAGVIGGAVALMAGAL